MAAELESEAAELHYRFAVRTCAATFNKTVSKLRAADNNHADLIAEFSYGRGLCLTIKAAKPNQEALLAYKPTPPISGPAIGQDWAFPALAN